MIKKIISFIFVPFVFLSLPLFTFAQNFNQSIGITNPFNCGGAGGNCTLLTLITSILNGIIMPIAAVACVFWVILAGFKYVQAKGNPAKVQEAHQNLLWALIGVGVILAATGISAVLQATVKSFLN